MKPIWCTSSHWGLSNNTKNETRSVVVWEISTWETKTNKQTNFINTLAKPSLYHLKNIWESWGHIGSIMETEWEHFENMCEKIIWNTIATAKSKTSHLPTTLPLPPKKNCVSCDCLDVSQRNRHKIVVFNFLMVWYGTLCYFALLNPLKMCWNLDLKHGTAAAAFSNDDGWICVHHLLRGYDWPFVNFVMPWKWQSTIGRSSQIQLQPSFLN